MRGNGLETSRLQSIAPAFIAGAGELTEAKVVVRVKFRSRVRPHGLQ